jgi:hypothetical protein
MAMYRHGATLALCGFGPRFQRDEHYILKDMIINRPACSGKGRLWFQCRIWRSRFECSLFQRDKCSAAYFLLGSSAALT